MSESSASDRVPASGQAATPTPSADALADRAAATAARHRARLLGLVALCEAERELGRALRVALAPEPRPPSGLWARLQGALGGRPPRADADARWARHQDAVRAVRGLGHHLEAMERDLALLTDELAALRADGRDAADAADRLSQARDPDPDGRRRRAVDRSRLAARQAETQATLHRDLQRQLAEHVDAVARLHAAGLASVEALSRHLTTLSELEAREVAGRVLDGGPQGALAETCHLADEHARLLRAQADDLAARLIELDREAAMRRSAATEVEALTRDSRP